MESLLQIIRVEKRGRTRIIAGLQEESRKWGAFVERLLKMNQWDLRE
jgi:hypothetical protein